MTKANDKSDIAATVVGRTAGILTATKTIALFITAVFGGLLGASFWLGSTWMMLGTEMSERIQQIERLEASLHNLEETMENRFQAIARWSSVEGNGSPSGYVNPGTPANSPSVCPPAYYVTGILTHGVPNGALAAVEVQCRPINTQ